LLLEKVAKVIHSLDTQNKASGGDGNGSHIFKEGSFPLTDKLQFLFFIFLYQMVLF